MVGAQQRSFLFSDEDSEFFFQQKKFYAENAGLLDGILEQKWEVITEALHGNLERKLQEFEGILSSDSQIFISNEADEFEQLLGLRDSLQYCLDVLFAKQVDGYFESLDLAPFRSRLAALDVEMKILIYRVAPKVRQGKVEPDGKVVENVGYEERLLWAPSNFWWRKLPGIPQVIELPEEIVKEVLASD